MSRAISWPHGDERRVVAVAVAGDWHLDATWAAHCVREAAARGVGTILHAGDFSVLPGAAGEGFLDAVEAACTRYGVNILVTPGNHEDWGRLAAAWSLPEHQDDRGRRMPLPVSEHVRVLPRGFRFVLGGRTFVSLGGAPSLNYQFLDEGRTWWPEEAISDLDVEHVVAAGHADVMLVHDAPGPPWCVDAVADALAQNDMGWTDRALAYASEHRDRVTRAFLTVQPRLLVHGHYHVGGNATVQIPGADYQTSIWSLHRNGHAANLRFLDLATLDSPI